MLLRTLPRLTEFEHFIITLKEPGELAPKFVSTGISVDCIHCTNFFDFAGIKRLRKIIKQENPEVVITYLFHADMLGRVVLRGVAQGPVIPFLRTTYNHPRYIIARVLEWLTRPLVSKYLANSEAVKNFYINHIGVQPTNITVIPNGIDVACFDTVMPDPGLKKSLSVQPEDFVIICVANLLANKGHRYLLEAFESLGRPNTKLLLIGDGPERQNLEDQITKYQSKGNIIFLGKRTDISNLFKISNIFVLPTLFEGMSNAIMEAMASGVPVITTDIPENRELITHNETGLLCPAKDTKCISDTISTLVSDNAFANQLSANGKNTMGKQYALHNISKQWKNYLDGNSPTISHD